jgi:hypothetical protein
MAGRHIILGRKDGFWAKSSSGLRIFTKAASASDAKAGLAIHDKLANNGDGAARITRADRRNW